MRSIDYLNFLLLGNKERSDLCVAGRRPIPGTSFLTSEHVHGLQLP
jgi:hypothetical protein